MSRTTSNETAAADLHADADVGDATGDDRRFVRRLEEAASVARVGRAMRTQRRRDDAPGEQQEQDERGNDGADAIGAHFEAIRLRLVRDELRWTLVESGYSDTQHAR